MTLAALMFRRFLAMLNRSFRSEVWLLRHPATASPGETAIVLFSYAGWHQRDPQKAIKSNLEKRILMRYTQEILKAREKVARFEK